MSYITRRSYKGVWLHLFILMTLLPGCKVTAFNEGESVATAEQPVLRTETLVLPSEGRVNRLEGKALLLKKLQNDGYKDLALGQVANDGDILVLYAKSVVVFEFPRTQPMTLESDDKSRWFTIRVEQ